MNKAATLLLGSVVFWIPGVASGEAAATLETAPGSGQRASNPVEHLRVHVLRSFPHDPGAYTQGLLWDDGAIVESTGRWGSSVLRRWHLAASLSPTGEVEEVVLKRRFFGEGLAKVEVLNGQLVAAEFDHAPPQALVDVEEWSPLQRGHAPVRSR